MEVVRALFTTSSTRDIETLPHSNKIVLGVTSLWMVIPVGWGLRQIVDGTAGESVLPETVCLALVCVASTAFWRDPKCGSWLHRLDKGLAWVFLCIMGWYSRDMGAPFLAPVVLSIVVCFLLSNYFFQHKMDYHQLLAHLLFRCISFWWAYFLVVPPDSLSVIAFVAMSCVYFGHALSLHDALEHELFQWDYPAHCGAMLGWIGLCGLLVY